MPWTQTKNVAMYGGANWDGYINTVANCSPAQAQRIALKDPNISFFFYCRDGMVLTNPTWPAPRVFHSGDAVFFSGQPWYGSASQCDSYQKNGMSVAYIGGDSGTIPLSSAGCYTTSDGGNAIDVVCIMAANINLAVPTGYVALAPNVTVATGGSYACANAAVAQALDVSTIQALQAQGITVLLTFLNNWDASGWSEFSSAANAQNFVAQLQYVVSTYGLDGIDIDDEYSTGTPVLDSLAMVTSMMRTAMPDIIISKALYNDSQYFGVAYNGVTLEQTLTYGWEMNYGSPPGYWLPAYVTAGMAQNALLGGFTSRTPSSDPVADVTWLQQNGYAGVMVYAFNDSANITLLGSLVVDWCGAGNWNQTPNCP